MNTIFKIIVSMTLISLTVIAVWFLSSYLDLQKQKIANEARFQCAQSAKYESRTETTTTTYPPEELYKKCLKEKGLN